MYMYRAPATILSLQWVGGVTPRADDCLEGCLMAHFKNLDESIPNTYPCASEACMHAEEKISTQTSALKICK
jgi:hypothetical protein